VPVKSNEKNNDVYKVVKKIPVLQYINVEVTPNE